jgi:hypothetical protein
LNEVECLSNHQSTRNMTGSIFSWTMWCTKSVLHNDVWVLRTTLQCEVDEIHENESFHDNPHEFFIEIWAFRPINFQHQESLINLFPEHCSVSSPCCTLAPSSSVLRFRMEWTKSPNLRYFREFEWCWVSDHSFFGTDNDWTNCIPSSGMY